ncbi:long-chain fatty acid--CoA ligase [Alicyclobacillus tolerans]|uniref:AMP-dependent synthetase/ligase n=1 Tax=Alicyclobacillus tolerans TaxID=90970 RepID=UPI001F2390ED|nr:long-chain fatty acid--CoA ligase [Alicyclobacillus tolerans]MCF8563963.1 long-chain fatty acid--CoA ligase [Alicyclobacillus tolerans]
MNLVELLYDTVLEHGTKEALRYKHAGEYHSMTYQQLWETILQFANGLKALHVKSGDKIGLLSTNCPEWVVSDFALMVLGAVVVPIYPTIPANQVEYILNNAEVSHIIVEDQGQLKKVEEVWPEHLQTAIVIKEASGDSSRRILTFGSVLQLGQRDSSLPDIHSISEEQLVSIVHTSGTSGNPKGVMLSHRNLVSNVQASLSILPVESTDVSLSYLPLSHIFERTVEEYATLSTGATVVYAEGIDAIQANLKETRPTILVTVPRLLEKVYAGVQTKLQHAPRPMRALLKKGLQSEKTSGLAYRLVDRVVYQKLREGLGGRIRAVVSGGAGLAQDIAEFYIRAGIPIYEGYGMTEAAPVIAANPFGASRPGTVGRPIPGVQVRLADDGELLVRGPNVMMGYYNNPEETAKTVTPDGWLHTGDIAEIQPDGYLKIVDRKKNILVLATGKNVAPWPIENAISLSPYIAEAVLVGDRRQYVSALIVPDFPALESMAHELSLGADRNRWLSHPKIRSLLSQEIAKTAADFAPFEQPKRAVLLAHELTQEAGDLTPTLKVKNKVILQKYGDLIEAMYNGVDYLPISRSEPFEETGSRSAIVQEFSSAEPETAASIPAGAVYGDFTGDALHQSGAADMASNATAVAPRTSKRRRWLIAAVVLVVLVGGGLSMASAHVAIPQQLNLLGMVRRINNNNDSLTAENGKIVRHMQQIDKLSGQTQTLGNQLQSLNQGVAGDVSSLKQLQALSIQEQNLSQQFVQLGQVLHGNLNSINNSSTGQSQTTSAMVSKMNQLSAAAANMAKSNQALAQKLAKASAQTGQIATEMP